MGRNDLRRGKVALLEMETLSTPFFAETCWIHTPNKMEPFCWKEELNLSCFINLLHFLYTLRYTLHCVTLFLIWNMGCGTCTWTTTTPTLGSPTNRSKNPLQPVDWWTLYVHCLVYFLTVSQSVPLGDVDVLMLNRCTFYCPIKHLLCHHLHVRDFYKMLTYPFPQHCISPHLYVYDVLGQIYGLPMASV